MKRINTKVYCSSKLEKFVARWMNKRAVDYPDTGINGVFDDLQHGGCVSGFVGELVYYTDTVKFYHRFRADIADLLQEAMQSHEIFSMAELFGDKWDKDDPLALGDLNQNLLAWFGFEEAAYVVYGRWSNS